MINYWGINVSHFNDVYVSCIQKYAKTLIFKISGTKHIEISFTHWPVEHSCTNLESTYKARALIKENTVLSICETPNWYEIKKSNAKTGYYHNKILAL